MSRIAKKPLVIPAGVNVSVDANDNITVKGKKGEFKSNLHEAVVLEMDGNVIYVKAKSAANPMVGTTRKMLQNMVQGVNEGFEKKLQLVGVGYRAKVQGTQLELSLGFSHPVVFEIPEGISIEMPSNTEIVIKGIDPQKVGEIAAKIRKKRPPEPYKGKGVRYFGEKVVIKETKKK